MTPCVQYFGIITDKNRYRYIIMYTRVTPAAGYSTTVSILHSSERSSIVHRASYWFDLFSVQPFH